MFDFDQSCVILIDYDNLLPQQKTAGFIDLVSKVLLQMPFGMDITRIECEVRVYGGWYEETSITALAQQVSVDIQKSFPTIIRHEQSGGAQIVISVQAELAMALLQEPSYHLFHTFRHKGKPKDVHIKNQEEIGCNDPECIIPLMKKFLKKGICPKSGCQVGQRDLIYRHEQKIVDTMLTCDLIYAAKQRDYIALVSSDDDFLPPLRTVSLQGIQAIRFHTQLNNRRFSYPPGSVSLIEKDL